MRTGKAVWLVDAAYLFNAQESVKPGYNFDYLKLRKKLEDAGPIAQAYYFNSVQFPPSEGQAGFHSWLQMSEGPHFILNLFKLKTKDYECPHCSHQFSVQVQKGVDVGLATLVVRLAYQDKYDTLILSSGDGDLKDAIIHVRDYCNKRIELCVFRSGVSPELQSFADRVWWIDDFACEVAK